MSLFKKTLLAGSYIALPIILSCTSPEMVFDLEKSYQKVSQDEKAKKDHTVSLRMEKLDLDRYFIKNKNLQAEYESLVKQSNEIKEKLTVYEKDIQKYKTSEERYKELDELIPKAQEEHNKVKSDLKLLEDRIKNILEKKEEKNNKEEEL